MFEELDSLSDVRAFVEEAYGRAQPRARMLGGSGTPERLPLAVAEPGPLFVRAVQVAGADGLTLQELRGVFRLLGKDRFARGVDQLRVSGRVAEARERRPNRAGRPQSQVVFRAQR